MSFSLPFRLLSFLFFSLVLSFPALCQYTVKGLVLDSLHKKPVPYAMVFIEGSTKGTVTNDEGFFVLENIPIPSSLIVNHISYQPRQFSIDGHTRDMKILLEEKNLQLSEVVVTNKNLRQKNIKEFNHLFLGNDYWGNKAVLENDSVLIFQRLNTPVDDSTVNSLNFYKEISVFSAKAQEPLSIDLPQLGYKLYLILNDFSAHSYGGRCLISSLGYYYYQPYDETTMLNNKAIQKNRRQVYYNSSQHFCRSLYAGTLAQNGYKVVKKSHKEEGEYRYAQAVDFESYFLRPVDNQRMITGLEGEKFQIMYFHKSDGSPRDLTQQRETGLIDYSEVHFLSDTCIIRSDGSIPDNSIVFSGKISNKKAGASLPDDYEVK